MKEIKIISEIIFIIAKNYAFTKGSKESRFIMAQCSARLRGILGSRLCQEAPFEDKFDLIEAKFWGVNEQVNFRGLH